LALLFVDMGHYSLYYRCAYYCIYIVMTDYTLHRPFPVSVTKPRIFAEVGHLQGRSQDFSMGA